MRISFTLGLFAISALLPQSIVAETIWYGIEHFPDRCSPTEGPGDFVKYHQTLGLPYSANDIREEGTVVETTIKSPSQGAQVTFYRGKQRCETALIRLRNSNQQDIDRYNVDTKSPLVVTTYQRESGIIRGALIKKGGSLHLSGISNGDISVAAGGELIVLGTVNGTVINDGGTVRVDGTVREVRANSGSVEIGGVVKSVSGHGRISYRKGAMVGGSQVK